MTFFISCENGRVSRFNSGDLAGKCAASNRQQKIALRAENNCSSLIMFGAGWIFCAFAQFSAGIGPAHFPAETTRLLSRGCLPFSPKIRYKIFLEFSNYIRDKKLTSCPLRPTRSHRPTPTPRDNPPPSRTTSPKEPCSSISPVSPSRHGSSRLRYHLEGAARCR